MPKVKKSNNIEKDKAFTKFTYWEWILIIGLLIIIAFAPYVFTQYSDGPDFSNTGQIGDTIGGITAPFVNLLAAFLVYKSFSAQILANKQQRSDHNEQMKQLNKEHTLNYISNLFILIKEFYSNNKIDKFSGNKHIPHIFSICKESREIIDSDLINGRNSDYHKQEHGKRIKSSNDKIINDLLGVKSNLENIYEFLNELNKSSIDEGIIKFYYREIESIIEDMLLFKITEETSLRELSNYKIIK